MEHFSLTGGERSNLTGSVGRAGATFAPENSEALECRERSSRKVCWAPRWVSPRGRCVGGVWGREAVKSLSPPTQLPPAGTSWVSTYKSILS